MTASDYPINFPYGATSAPYSATHPHRGDDRLCPEGTPVVISGVTIGLTGATGKVIGAHLHIQEWNADYANTRKPQNAFQPGIVVNIDPDGTQGDGSFGKFITIQNADGWNDSYCHLSEINVSVGQEIGGNMPTLVDANILENLSVGLLGRTSVGDANLANWLGAPLEDALAGFIHYPEHQALIQRADGTLPNGFEDSKAPTPPPDAPAPQPVKPDLSTPPTTNSLYDFVRLWLSKFIDWLKSWHK